MGVRVDVNAMLGVGVILGDVNQYRRYCTMYKKVYRIKKIKKNVCGGEGNI